MVAVEAAVTGVAVTEAVVERVEEVAEATEVEEAAEAEVAAEAVAAEVSCSRLVEPCARAPWWRTHRVRRSAKRPPALRLAYRHALIGEPRQWRLRCRSEVWRWGLKRRDGMRARTKQAWYRAHGTEGERRCISGRHARFLYCFSRLYTTPQSHTSYQTLLQVTPRVEPPQVSSWAPGAISAGRQPRNVHRVSVLRPRFATAGRP